MISKIPKIKISLLAFFFINTFMILTIFIEDKRFLVGMESGISEHLSAIFYLLAFILSFWTFIINKQNRFCLFFSIFCLICGLEESNYLSNYINYQIPLIQNLNVQNDISIHNLKFFHGGSLRDESFSLRILFKAQNFFRGLFITHFFLLPLLSKIRLFSKSLKKIKYILPSKHLRISVGFTLLINLIITFLYAKTGRTRTDIAEVRELTYAIYIYIYALCDIYSIRFRLFY